MRDQYDTGADPVVVLTDLAEFIHFVTRVKIVPRSPTMSRSARPSGTRARDFAAKLSMRVLSRTWQMLLKGIAEVQGATRPVAAAEMVLVRIAYAADLPTPDEAVRMLDQNGGGSPSVGMRRAQWRLGAVGRSASIGAAVVDAADAGAARFGGSLVLRPSANGDACAASRRRSAPVLTIATFEDWWRSPRRSATSMMRAALERDVRLVRFEDGRIELALERTASRTLINDLSRKLEQWTGRRWSVIVSNAEGQPTLRSQALHAADRARTRRRSRPAGAGGAGAFPRRRDRSTCVGSPRKRRRRWTTTTTLRAIRPRMSTTTIDDERPQRSMTMTITTVLEGTDHG